MLTIIFNQGGGGAVSPPNTPLNLTATAISDSSISLTWQSGGGAPEDGYAIERSFDGVNWNALATSSAGSLGYNDFHLAPEKTYYYRIYAFNSGGSSAYSNIANATTLKRDTSPVQGGGGGIHEQYYRTRKKKPIIGEAKVAFYFDVSVRAEGIVTPIPPVEAEGKVSLPPIGVFGYGRVIEPEYAEGAVRFVFRQSVFSEGETFFPIFGEVRISLPKAKYAGYGLGLSDEMSDDDMLLLSGII